MSADNNEENIPLQDFEGNKSVNNTHEQETSENSVNRFKACAIIQKNKVLSILVIIGFISVVVIVVAPVYMVYGNRTKNNANISVFKPQASHRNTILDDRGIFDHLIIDQNRPCGTDCINCTLVVLGPKNASVSQGKSCEASFEPNIKNSSCYQCGDQCLTFESLSSNTTCGRPLDCCVYAIMGNLNKYCGEDGQYICEYSADRPVCDCPAGKIGRICNKTYTQQVLCKCYKRDLQFSQQEQMVECNSKDRTTNSSVCQIYQTINNKRHNCICYQDKTSPKQDLCNSSIRHEIYSKSP